MLKVLDRLFCYVRLHRWSEWKHEFNDEDWIVICKSKRHCQVCKVKQENGSADILY